MDRVLLLAYTNINFGDDLFIKTICEYFPNIKFEIEAPKTYRKIFKNTNNIYVKKCGVLKHFKDIFLKKIGQFINLEIDRYRLKKYKAVVYVVGGLFDEDDIWYDYVNRFGLINVKKYIWKNSFVEGVPFYLLGCNVTRVKTKKYIQQMKYLFEGISDICFRDKYSYNYFKDLKNTRYAPDIVFNYMTNNLEKDGSILISVWGPLTVTENYPQWKWARELWYPYEKFIIKIIHEFQKKDKKIILLSLCENEGDLKACNRILEDGEFESPVEIVNYTGNLDEVIRLFEKADFVLGTRFHSIIMAINSRCRFYPVVYESKTEQLLKDINYCGRFSHIENMDSYNISYVMNAYENNIDYIDVREKASEQFKNLSKLLND